MYRVSFSKTILIELHTLLITRFNDGELRTLCLHLEVDYDGLAGEGKINRARELLTYLNRRHQIPKLLEAGKQLRPDINWINLSDMVEHESLDDEIVPFPAEIPPLSENGIRIHRFEKHRSWAIVGIVFTFVLIIVIFLVRLIGVFDTDLIPGEEASKSVTPNIFSSVFLTETTKEKNHNELETTIKENPTQTYTPTQDVFLTSSPSLLSSGTPLPTHTLTPTPLYQNTPVSKEGVPLTGYIVFASERDGDADIYIANADGSQPQNLTNNEIWGDSHPVWSLDGSKIAFVSRVDGNQEIYLMNADGTGLKNLTNSSADEDYPQWLPDNSQIVFRSGNAIYRINANGLDRQLVTQSSVFLHTNFQLSPDGSKVAYSTGYSGDAANLYVVNIDGSHRIQLGTGDTIAWSPDSFRVASVAEFDGRYDLYTIKADGTDLQLITQNSSVESTPVWSPDGRKLYYIDNRDLTKTIFVAYMNSDDLLIDTISTDISGRYLDVSSDGNWLVLSGYHHSGSTKSVFLVNNEGSPPIEIVSDLSFWDDYVDWYIPIEDNFLENSASSLPVGTPLPTLTFTPTPQPDNDSLVDGTQLGGRFVFSASYGDGTHIYVVNADGSERTKLTQQEDWNGNPRWSPDGSKIAFVSNRDGNKEIYLINADGTGLKNLTNSSADEDYPQWLPDNSQIVFRSGNAIYRINANGLDRQLVVQNSAFLHTNFQLSPNSSKVAYSTGYSGDTANLYVVNIDGSHRIQLGTGDAIAWSPDSSRVASVAEFDGRYDLYTIKADGTDLQLITQNSSIEKSPRWSHDGQKIYYLDNRTSQTIYYADLINLDNPTGTISTELGANYFDLSPDGNWIMISAYSGSSNRLLYLLSIQGSTSIVIAENLWNDHFDWNSK